jgi:hypothetical protein
VINLGSLRDAQAADCKNNKIPPGATDGAVNWVRIDNVPVTGRLVVVQRNGGVASNYDCCTCQCPLSLMGSGATISPLTGFMAVGNAADFLFTAVFENCNNVQYPYNETNYAAWSSGNTIVMTMDQTYHGEAHGLSSGTAGNQAQVSECGYYYSYLGKCYCSYQTQATGQGQGAVGARVEISGIQSDAPTVNINTPPKSATVTVTLYHFGTNNVTGATATVEISAYTGTPVGNSLDGLPSVPQQKGIQAPDGYTSFPFTVTAAQGVTMNGSVSILGKITGHTGSVTVVSAPSPPKDKINLVTVKTTTN